MKNNQPSRFLRVVLWRGQRFANFLRNKLIYARDARELNRVLFADVTQLDQAQVEFSTEKILEFSAARGFDKGSQALWKTHVYRLMITEKWIDEILRSHVGEVAAMDLGVESVTSDYWRFKFPNVHWHNTDWDVRLPWKTPASSLDLIVCTELVEHLSDQPNEIFNEGFYKLGFIALLKESYQALKPGGYLFLTTPNAASVLHIKLVLQGDPPWFFIKHVREYTLNEVLDQATAAGFETVRTRDIHCMSVMAYPDFSSIFQILLENGFSIKGRGDDLFVVLRKPR